MDEMGRSRSFKKKKWAGAVRMGVGGRGVGVRAAGQGSCAKPRCARERERGASSPWNTGQCASLLETGERRTVF